METNSKFQDEAIAPMHTAEHILNQTMVRLFGCPRSTNAHIDYEDVLSADSFNHQILQED